MRNSDEDDAVTRRIVRWAESRADVRAAILTSTRARPDAAVVDALSDWDVILYVADPTRLLGDASWTGELGAVLVQMPAAGREQAWSAPTRLVLYEDGTKIDFTVLPASALRDVTQRARFPAELDAGYRVLLDKDGLASTLPAASGTAYVLQPPTQAELTALVEEFWWETTYVAKQLWRGELLPAKYSHECVLTLDLLRRMLEWRVALDEGWTYRPGVMGRGLARRLPPDRWRALEETFVGADPEEMWRALSRTIALFREVATEVAARLGLEYPHDLDARTTRDVERIRNTPHRDDTG